MEVLTRRWVHELSTRIGIRLSGTDNDRSAADFIEAEFREIFPRVQRHEYRFLGWRPLQEGILEIAGESFPTRLAVATPSTPGDGVTGCLRRFGPSLTYGIWPDGALGAGAHIMVNDGPGGEAIPLLWQPFASMSAGIVGVQLQDRLALAEKEGEPVRFCCQTQYTPNTPSWNVEGIIPGDPERWVIIIGHYDTQYVSPGANDNTASTACLPALGKMLLASKRSSRPTYCFLATGGEEIDLQGARSYVRDLTWAGHDRRVVLALNFDSLTWGDTLQILSSANASTQLALLDQTHRSLQLPVYGGECETAAIDHAAGVDSVPFFQAGMPTLNINTLGDLDTTSLWHTPGDTEDRVPWPRIDDALTLFGEFLDQL